MDSPKREPRISSCELQGSPIFKFLCSLSPIKQAKSAHQTFSELSFPAPLPVFVSPRAKQKSPMVVKKEAEQAEHCIRIIEKATQELLRSTCEVQAPAGSSTSQVPAGVSASEVPAGSSSTTATTTTNQECLLKSTTCVRSLTFGMQTIDEVPFDIDTLVTPERKRLSLTDGERSRTPKKKSRKSTSSIDGCKRCHCKKSKCLKLYCECFAAGVYCLDSCACRDCFNKPEFSETVLGTRQQIETRNPLAFAPKVVQTTSETSPVEGIPCPDTVASARHKRGCNCKKSLCLKKYCECYQSGVGCSDGCRCNGCKNIYGIKKAQDEADQSDDQLPSNNVSVTSISPLTPTFPHAPPLLDSSDFRRIYESAPCSLVQSCTSEDPEQDQQHEQVKQEQEQQPSPRWEGLDDICTITPLPQHPLRPPCTSEATISLSPLDRSSFLPMSCDAITSSPPQLVAAKPQSQFCSDETPTFLSDERCSPRTVIKGSPKQKRVVPPNNTNTNRAPPPPSSVLRSRKLTLQTLPSLPPVTPFNFATTTQQQGNERG